MERSAICPPKDDLRLKVDGKPLPINSLQVATDEAIALGFVAVHSSDLVDQESARIAKALGEDLLEQRDRCTVVNSARTSLRDNRPLRKSDGSFKGCQQDLREIDRLLQIWVGVGSQLGFVPYPQEGIATALRELSRVDLARRLCIVIGPMREWGRGFTSSVQRLSRKFEIPLISVHFAPYYLTGKKEYEIQRIEEGYGVRGRGLRANLDELERNPIYVMKGRKVLEQLAVKTRGEFHHVAVEDALGKAREVISRYRKQCVLTFVPPAQAAGGRHQIQVTEIRHKGWRVRHRSFFEDRDVGARPPDTKPH